MVLFVILVLLKLNPNSSVISVFLICLFLNYINGLSLSSIGGTCNPYQNTAITKSNFLHSSLLHILVSILLGFIAIFTSSITSSKSENLESIKVRKSPEEAEKVETANEHKSNSIEIVDDVFGNTESVSPEEKVKKLRMICSKFIIFHFLMIVFSFYIGNHLNYCSN